MKISKETGFYLFLLAGGLVVAGNHFDLPWLTAVSVLFIGIIALVGGIGIIIRGKAKLGKVRISNPNYIERYRGLSARLMGLFISFAGLVFISLAVAGLLYRGGANIFLTNLAESKYGLTLILGMAGLIGMAWGIVRFMTGTATAPGTHARHIEFSIKFRGAIITLLSLVALVLAIAEILQPGFIDGLLKQFVDWIKSLILNK